MTDFLLELRSEEIPARMQAGARADLVSLFQKEMHARGEFVDLDPVVWSTPRRLVLISRNLPEQTDTVTVEIKGPKESAPEAALQGFLRKNGLQESDLTVNSGTYFANVVTPGRSMLEVLAEVVPAIVRAFPWPKSMRWGAASLSTESLRWVRPLSGIVALFGDDLVECRVGEVASGTMTLGHRFHHAGPITIGSASDYQEKLRACHVIVDHAERQDLIRASAAKAAAEAGLALVEDEGLVIENAGLTEWPVPLLGRFDEAFLDVPPEVIQLTARVNQKYFVCEEGGKLANAFVCTANIEAADGGAAIVDGNRKVLAARLSDARFFWEQDRKVPLAEQAKKLERITFHEKLGTVADKVERVKKLALWLVQEDIVRPLEATAQAKTDLYNNVQDAAAFAKADLVTEMVGEFPELQGLMGGYYARAEGLPDEVADAIRDHYKPVGQGDEVPTAPVTVAVSLADKLDTLAGFFCIDEKPTGSKDPFALRRAAIGVLRLIGEHDLRASWGHVLTHLVTDTTETAVGTSGSAFDGMKAQFSDQIVNSSESFEGTQAVIDRMEKLQAEQIVRFLVDRLKVQQREAGVRHDLIDAVFALGNEDDLVRLLARVNALQAFIKTEDGANLLAAYKRAANILKKEDWTGAEDQIARTGEEDPLALVDDPDLKPVIEAKLAEKKKLSYTPEPAEKELIEALDSAEPKAAAAVQAEDFEAAMAALASLRGPIDRFFDSVTVNDSDAGKRSARLDLLGRFRSAVHQVADFSKIEG